AFTQSELRPTACKALEPFAQENSPIGAQAAHILIVYDLSKERFADAQFILDQNPYLKKQTLGIELAAQIAIAEGNLDQAEALLRPIADHSAFAAEILTARAIERGDWPSAERYMTGLIALNPSSYDYRSSLAEIQKHRQPTATKKPA
ncbi:MAG TPA: hypothetical protein PLV25_02235, partial [Opitutales bacterium]|nr:hypothetical protein [Opitutales bacterium]